MKRQLTILCCFVCNISFCWSQDKFVDSLIGYIDKNPTVDSLYILTLHRISYRLSEKDVKRSFAYYEKVASLSDSMNFTYGKALSHVNLGILLSNSANFEASNNAYFKAVDEAEICGSQRLKAVSLNNIGDNFRTLKDYEKSRQYTYEAIELNKSLSAWRGVAINYELLYECDFDEKLYSEARKKLLTGMPFAIQSNESYILSQFYLGFGKLFANDKRIDSATFYFDRALEQAKLQNDLRNEYEVYLARAQYLEKIRPSEKIMLLDSALTIAKRTAYLKGESDAAQQLSAAYDGQKNKDMSLYFYRLYRSASDSLFSDNNKRNVIIKEAEWMLKRKEIENAHLKEVSALQRRELNIKNGLLIAGVISLILIVIAAVFINISVRLKKKREEAAFKQKIAETQMQALRAQMNPHFIFNSLSSIENFIMKNDKLHASDYLTKFASLIRMILDSSRNELVPFGKDIDALRLYTELEQLRFNNKFCFDYKIDKNILEGDYKVPPLLIQPYVENAILHGLAPASGNELKLEVQTAIDDDYIIYRVHDNGIGRKQSAAYKQQNKPVHISMGMQITEERISIFNKQKNSNGEVTITDLYDENGKPTGTNVYVKIKAM